MMCSVQRGGQAGAALARARIAHSRQVGDAPGSGLEPAGGCWRTPACRGSRRRGGPRHAQARGRPGRAACTSASWSTANTIRSARAPRARPRSAVEAWAAGCCSLPSRPRSRRPAELVARAPHSAKNVSRNKVANAAEKKCHGSAASSPARVWQPMAPAPRASARARIGAAWRSSAVAASSTCMTRRACLFVRHICELEAVAYLCRASPGAARPASLRDRASRLSVARPL